VRSGGVQRSYSRRAQSLLSVLQISKPPSHRQCSGGGADCWRNARLIASVGVALSSVPGRHATFGHGSLMSFGYCPATRAKSSTRQLRLAKKAKGQKDQDQRQGNSKEKQT
jgi:hypothetical protein